MDIVTDYCVKCLSPYWVEYKDQELCNKCFAEIVERN